MKVYVVTKGIYSDFNLVAIKSNREAAERLMKKCSYCHGTGKDPYYDEFDCEHCGEEPLYSPPLDWNTIREMEVEDE
jgi:hypothetical protein